MIESIAKPLIESLVSNIVAPKIDIFLKRVGLECQKHLIPQREHFREYFFRTYKKYSILNTLVFRNSQRELNDLYIPLTLHLKTNGKVEQIKIDGYPEQLALKYQKLLITDSAGMGKSTITKKMFLDIIDNGYGIPIYVELRRLTKDHSLLHEIGIQLNSLSKEFDTQLLLELIQSGGFVFFLDGYDEIKLSEKTSVTIDIQEFISKAGDNTFILTSRPENSLVSFGDFQQVTIEPLKKKEAYELLRKYDGQGETSSLLIDKLKSGKYDMIDEFLKNPLLVTLLFVAFDYKQTIPLKKHVFYRQVYDAHFDGHDLSKGGSFIHEKKSKLDIDDFDKILRFTGFECLKLQKIEFSKDEILIILGKAKTFWPNIQYNESDLLDDLLCAVPLFCQDGAYYKWSHKSLQEYFAAQFIYKDAKSGQDKILTKLYNSNHLEKYLNLLDLYYDIDQLGFRKNILLPFLSGFVNYFEREAIGKFDDITCALYNRRCYSYISREHIEFEDVFNKILEIDSSFKPHFGVQFDRNTWNVFLIDGSTSPKRPIIDILANKRLHFIEILKYAIPKEESEYGISKIEKLQVNNIAHLLHKHVDNESVCREIGALLSSLGRNETIYLNFDKCKEEILAIRKEINVVQETDNLLSGL